MLTDEEYMEKQKECDLSKEITRLRSALEKYADPYFWDHVTDDEMEPWTLAQEALNG